MISHHCTRENLHWKTENALLTVSSLLDYIGIFWDDKRWDEYLDLKDSGKILWVNPSDTFDARTELDQCEWIVRVYVDCPFRSNKFEYHLIRLFMYIYARSACYEFHISYPISDYTFDKDLTLRELANESFAIENRKVLTYPNYTAKKHNPLLYYLSTEIIYSVNIGCINQISRVTKITILHTVEIIDWYKGGPKPKVLEKLL